MEYDQNPEILSPKEKAEKIKEYISDAEDMILERNYKEAMHYFVSGHEPRDFAKSLGILFREPEGMILRKTVEKDDPTIPAKQDRLADAGRSEERSEIRLSVVVPLSENIQVPDELYQEAAITNLEEWLHQIQFITGEPLEGEEDIELDVAIYMKKKNIPVTDQFKKRHDRDKAGIFDKES